ncbi:hypothetical protein [Thermococcus sp.]
MKVRYWLLVFAFYIFATFVQETVSVWDFVGFVVLVLAFIVDRKRSITQREPYIIGNSNKIDYLTSEELEERLQEKRQA